MNRLPARLKLWRILYVLPLLFWIDQTFRPCNLWPQAWHGLYDRIVEWAVSGTHM